MSPEHALPQSATPPARSRRGVIALVTVLVVLVTARLGLWQLNRADQKLALQQSLAERGRMPPLLGPELARDEASAAHQQHRTVQVRGRWRPGASVWLDNRAWNGRAGFIVLTPFELGAGDAVLVQRGWVPRDPQDRLRVPPLPNAPGERLLTARVVPPPSRTFALGGAHTEQGPIRQNLDVAGFGREVGIALRPLSLQQLQADVPAPAGAASSAQASAEPALVVASTDGLQRDWPAPATDVGKHHGYAFQWFAFSALALGLFLWFQILRPRRDVRP